MEHSVIAGWSEFMVAAAGVAGALAGLVFVTLSINLSRIIASPGVPGRAAETIILLAGALAGTLVALVPHWSAAHLAWTLAAVTVPTWLAPMVIQARSIRQHAYQTRALAVLRVVLLQIATLPGVLASGALLGFVPGGIGWFAFGVIASLLVGIFNAWILLVEIVR